jgi:hypothetical protein
MPQKENAGCEWLTHAGQHELRSLEDRGMYASTHPTPDLYQVTQTFRPDPADQSRRHLQSKSDLHLSCM